MSVAIRTMAGHLANATGRRRASDVGVCAYQWSADGITGMSTIFTTVPAYANKLHAQRPKEASQ